MTKVTTCAPNLVSNDKSGWNYDKTSNKRLTKVGNATEVVLIDVKQKDQ